MSKHAAELIIHKGQVGNIYEVRGIKVMLDSELAALYGVDTKALNQAVSRNQDRFPSDFAFMLTYQEFSNLKSQIVTSSWGGKRKLPQVFTEHGVLMLSSVLKSKQATLVNIQIMRAFIALRESLANYTQLKAKLAELEDKYDSQFKIVFEAIKRMLEYEVKDSGRRIGFDTSVHAK